MIIQLIRRNLLVYFRDKASVFFSMLGVIVILGLYILFLGDMMSGFGEYAGENSRFMMDSWIMAGVISVSSITTTMGAFGTMINDREKKIVKDFEVAPIKKSSLLLGYVLSSFIIGLIMSIFTFILAELYIVAYGGDLLSFTNFLIMMGLIVIAVAASSSIVFVIIINLKTNNSFSTISTLLGTLIGFLTGIYVPMGSLPEFAQMVIKIFPVSHAALLMRQLMMGQALDLSLIDSANQQFMGLQFAYGDYIMPIWLHVVVLVATIVVFYLVSLLIISRRKNKE